MPGALDEATELVAVGEGEYAASLDARFSVGGMPHGGYLLALAERAAHELLGSRGVERAACLAASASYARAPRLGEAVLRAQVDRVGASVSQVHVVIEQRGRCAVRALCTLGRRRTGGVALQGAPAVELPEVDRCERIGPGGPVGRGISILERAELRVDPATPLRPTAPTATAEVRGWLRLDEERQTDERALLFLLDALPPATLALGSTGWVPTLQLSASIRALPTSVWLRARQVARWVRGGLVEQACELWDDQGGLVAEARQLAMVRFPPEA